MKHDLFIDLETYSPEPIAKTGLYKYAQSPDFQILLLAYGIDSEPVEVIDLTQEELPEHLVAKLFSPNVTKHAYNAAFEVYCLSQHFGLSDNEIIRWLPQWRDTMLHASYCGYPLGLDAAGKALGLSEDKQKMAVGKALIRYFCVPCKPTKTNGGRTRNLPHHDPAKWDLFKQYNAQDVVTEIEIDRRLENFQVPDAVQKQWELDQIINIRGVAVDSALVESALYCGESERQKLLQEASELSGLDNPNSIVQLMDWLDKEAGVEVTDLRKDTVKELLKTGVPSASATRMLEIRQELGKTSTKKYTAMETCLCADGRVRGMMQFYGANRSGREAGRLIQVQNLPHDTVPGESFARDLVKAHNIDALKVLYGSVPTTLAALIRTAFVPAEGKTFIDADFSAIEARVVAWLAGEEWVLEEFRGEGKIYEATASQMFGISKDRIKKGNPEYAYRAKGKVAALALGYGGSSGALINMGALKSGLTEEELPDLVQRWRTANPAIVNYWYTIDKAVMSAIKYSTTSTVGCVTVRREIDREHNLDFMTLELPSGRKLYYVNPHLTVNRFGKESAAYMGMDQTTKKWKSVESYGPKFVENLTQAVARDCLFYAMENLTAARYNIVFDIHDEVVIETDHGSLEDVVRIMSQTPPWAPGLPLNAAGWTGDYFRKD